MSRIDWACANYLTSPSPWAPQNCDLDNRGPSASDASSEHVPFPPSAPHAPWSPRAGPVQQALCKRLSAMLASSLGVEMPHSFSPATLPALTSSQSTSALTKHGLFMAPQQQQQPPLALVISHGSSPVVLGSQGADHVLPRGIRVFSSALALPVLSFCLLHMAPIEQFLSNASLLFSDSSQSDPSSRNFWLNMAALTGHFQKQASSHGPHQCAGAAAHQGAHGQCPALAKACRNQEEKRLLWQLLGISSTQGQGGSGHLLASWERLDGPRRPIPVTAQFTSKGSITLGAYVELVGSGYQMSLVKKRFATGIYLTSSQTSAALGGFLPKSSGRQK
ncbi:F-BAR domain only protein 1 [Crotalus adamanteus]|uniref:F-BAR domain only protein 1 n=1 Tax=Crotalus adamanteus TaxID=8729 RepID=A0AAW1BHE4_CROAD